jgi:hypothetical protein
MFGGRCRRLEDWKTGSLEVWKSGSLEVWKSGSLEVCKEKMILATADTRTTREQMIPKSKQSNQISLRYCINVPHRTQPSTHPSPVPSSQRGLLEAKNCSSPVSLRPQITLGSHPHYSPANLRVSVNFEDSSASLVGCFDLIGLVQGLTDRPELSHYPWLHGYYK